MERRIRLLGLLPADGAGELATELCLGPTGVWLVAADSRFVGRVQDAGDSSRIRYEEGRLRDRLLVDGVALTVPSGKAASVRNLLAQGRLRRNGYRGRPLVLPADRYVEAQGEPTRELVSALVPPSDVLVSLIALGKSALSKSELGASVPETKSLLVSAERITIFTLSELGDLRVCPLAAAELALEAHEGTCHLRAAGDRIPVSQRKALLLAEVLELCELASQRRLYEAARRLSLPREREPRAPRVRELLRAASDRGHLEARIALAFLRSEVEGAAAAHSEISASVGALREAELPESLVADVFTSWNFSAGAGRTVVTLLTAFGSDAEPWAIALHRRLHSAGHNPDAALGDLELAEHELASGEPARARALAQARLTQLSADEDTVLAPERASAARLTRVRLYEVLRREAERRGWSDVQALGSLARLEPSNPSRLTALANAPGETATERYLSERAAKALLCLLPDGLEGSGSQDGNRPFETLQAGKLDQHLRHPLARGGRLATRLSELVATTPEPDLGFLRDFCEALSGERHPEAARALARATRLFSLPSVRAYVSHGARSVGMRVFGAREPFVLVGQSHLAESGAGTLRAGELEFAFAAELSHLAFGHQRVTASEVWMGAAGKTRDALMAIGTVVPLLAELGGVRAQKLLTRLAPEAIGRAAEGALKLEQLFGPTQTQKPALGQPNEELIAAHRLVQLSADRAGLIACQELGPALRAMLLLRTEYWEILSLTRDKGLIEALFANATGPAYDDLRVRVRALIAFYLSADFEVLVSDPAT